MSKATIRPWKKETKKCGCAFIVGADNKTVAQSNKRNCLEDSTCLSENEVQANVDLIIQSVNEHEGWLAKLEKLEIENRNLKLKLKQKTDYDMMHIPII